MFYLQIIFYRKYLIVNFNAILKLHCYNHTLFITRNINYLSSSILFGTLESVWEPPKEGYMTIAEQEEEAKEEALQKELLEQLNREEAIEKADILEEQRANLEREKMREHRTQSSINDNDTKDDDESAEIKKEAAKEERPYWRDYSVPERPQPYGAWQVVETM